MLIVLFGPAGVGKTSLIRHLHRRHHFSILETYTTRPPRAHEDDRRSVTDDEYDAAVENGDVLHTSMVFGYRYGLHRKSLEIAVQPDSPVYVVDFALENAEDITAFGDQVVGVLVLPPSEAELKRRLSGRGRLDRVEDALQQYTYCLDAQREGLPDVIGDRVVVNEHLVESATEIAGMVAQYRPVAPRPDGGLAVMQDFAILDALRDGQVFERDTWDAAAIHQASYGLRVDTDAMVARAKIEAVTGTREYQVVRVPHDGHFELLPGDSALLWSAEHFCLSPSIAAITLPRGILVAHSLSPAASYIDPGFTGRFCIPVTNNSGRVVQVPAGIQAVRAVLIRLERPVATPWSAADATSLRSELPSVPSRHVTTQAELRAMPARELRERLRKESAGGPETAEHFWRTQRDLVILLTVAIAWPVLLLIANASPVRRAFGHAGAAVGGFLANVSAGLTAAAIVAVVTALNRLRRNRQG